MREAGQHGSRRTVMLRTRVTSILTICLAVVALVAPSLAGTAIPVSATDNNMWGEGRLDALNAATNYQRFLLQTGTAISEADAAANFRFATGDFNGDGIPDLYAIKVSNTGSGKLEVHVLNGATNYQSFLLQI